MNKRSILITGGAGFIGSHLVRLMVNQYPNTQFVNLDALTYAGNTFRLKDITSKPNYHFVHGNITDMSLAKKLFSQYDIDGVIHLAAESHVGNPLSPEYAIPGVVAPFEASDLCDAERGALRTADDEREWEGAHL